MPALTNTLFAYDPLNASPGPLNGVTTGTGWSGGWSVQNFSTSGSNFLLSSGTGTLSALTYGNLLTAGTTYAIGGSAFCASGRAFNLNATPYWFLKTVSGSSYIGADNTTAWISALVRVDKANTIGTFITLSSNNSPWLTTNYKAGVTISNGMWAVRCVDASGTNLITTQSTTPVTIGQTCLIAMKLDFGSHDVISLYINPASIGGAAPSTPTVSATAAGDIFFSELVFYPDESANQGSMDEIRLGDSFSAVTPIPQSALYNWRYAYFGTYGNTGNAADTANPMKDGIANLIKYATGISPLAQSDTPPAVPGQIMAGGSNYLTLSFNRIADPALTYSVEATNDLGSTAWSSIWSSTGASNVPGNVMVQDSVALGQHTKRFLRLSVSY